MGKKVMVDLIIFDLDGTLIESSRDIVWAVNKTLNHMGFDELPYDVIKSYIGWGVGMLLEQAIPVKRHNLLSEARELFLRYYEGHLLMDTFLYPGAKDVIEYFKDKKLAIVTNKPIGLTKKILDGLAISGYFKRVVGGDNVLNKKPHPQAIDIVLEELDIRPENTVFVGDSRIDIEAGKNAGVMTCGAVYGFRGSDELIIAGADFLIEDIKQLKNMLI
ncbi:MAG: HAD-IA family hydrolase [Deltaproteobacteria bacterium]|nr:HAD-IA family hydrolase [Deltaproteobacteria bacterium]